MIRHCALALTILVLAGSSGASAQVARARGLLRGGDAPSSSSPSRAPVQTPRPTAPMHTLRWDAPPHTRVVRPTRARIALATEVGWWAYRPFPYARGAAGYTFHPAREADAPARSGMFVGQVALGYLLGEVGEVDVRLSAVLGLLELFVRQRVLVEALQPNGVDAIGLGHLGIGVRLMRSQEVRARLHGDFTLAEDGLGVLPGASGGLDIDVYFGQPWALSVDGSIGVVGAACVLEGGASFGILEGPVELHVGWSVVSFLSTQGEGTQTFHGPRLMIRTWAS